MIEKLLETPLEKNTAMFDSRFHRMLSQGKFSKFMESGGADVKHRTAEVQKACEV